MMKKWAWIALLLAGAASAESPEEIWHFPDWPAKERWVCRDLQARVYALANSVTKSGNTYVSVFRYMNGLEHRVTVRGGHCSA